MSKKKKTIFSIFTESIGLYFSNFKSFIKYMSFPILGQIAGLILIFAASFIFTQNLPNLLVRFPGFDNWNFIILCSILVTLPGLIIFLKAFWEYLVAYGAINSMIENMLKSGRIYDFPAHTELVKRRTPTFIGIWFVIGILSLIAICPFFSIICGIFAVYFVIVFQVFTYEEEQTVFGCFRRSLQIIKGHFASTFILLVLAGILTYLFIPQIIIKLMDTVKLSEFFASLVLPLFKNIPEIDLTRYGAALISSKDIALITVQAFVAQILIQYTLPQRTIMWALWYKELCHTTNKAEKTLSKKSSKKRPSEKLMESTRKKYSKTKIDSNILKRAMEKDDDYKDD